MKTHYQMIAEKAWISKRTPMPERFWNKVNIGKEDACWPYQGTRHHFGHGAFKIDKKEIGAHRMAWIIRFGEIPKGMFVCHKCDNPPCCNPNHLFIGSHKDNMADASIKKRFPDRKGENSGNAIITNKQATEIKRRYIPFVVTQKMLASEFGASEGCISAIVKGRHFKNC